MKQKVSIVFPSIRQLWLFLKTTNVSSAKTNTTSNTLYCECERANIILAEKTFKARIIEPLLQYKED
jgi:hypothetical protein